MTNITLFKSALFFTFIHLYTIIIQKNIPIIFLTIIFSSLLTSLLNHGLKHSFFKYLDRFTIFIGVITDIYYIYLFTGIYSNILTILLFQSLLFYFISKIYKSNIYHVLSHAFITYTHIIIFLNLDDVCDENDIMCSISI
jgi:hypothetical protein